MINVKVEHDVENPNKNIFEVGNLVRHVHSGIVVLVTKHPDDYHFEGMRLCGSRPEQRIDWAMPRQNWELFVGKITIYQ